VTTPTYVYPPILDPVQSLADLPPHIRGTGLTEAMVRAGLEVLSRTDAEAADLVSQLVYPETATGATLDAVGTWVGEARGGMDDGSYRQIVLGALAAVVCRQAWRWDHARAMLLALTGAAADDLVMEVLDGCQTRARALVRYHPTDLLVRRIDRVLARAHPPGWAWSLHMYPEGALIADEVPGADVGLASWYVAGTGGA
jgi:hypothetical protein